jgi:hypothetical protein
MPHKLADPEAGRSPHWRIRSEFGVYCGGSAKVSDRREESPMTLPVGQAICLKRR